MYIIDFAAGTIATQAIQTASFVTATPLPIIMARYRGSSIIAGLSSEKLLYSFQKHRVSMMSLAVAIF